MRLRYIVQTVGMTRSMRMSGAWFRVEARAVLSIMLPKH